MRQALVLLIGVALLAGTALCVLSPEPAIAPVAGVEEEFGPCEGRRDAPMWEARSGGASHV